MVKIDTELQTFKEDIVLMGEQVRKMFVMALEVLESGDKKNALSIVELDEYVNNMNEEINDKGTEVLSLLSPVASDLRIVIAGIKIATDLERIGDYAKSIGRFIIRNKELDPRLLDYVRPIGEKFLTFFDMTLQAYKNADVKTALSIPSHDDEIDAAFKKLFVYLETAQNAGQFEIAALIPTIGMLRNIERAGDHTKNICENIIYEVKGQHYDFG